MQGLRIADTLDSCQWTPIWTTLTYVVPTSCIFRVFLAPAMWTDLGEQRCCFRGSVPAIAWVAAFCAAFIPLFAVMVQPGILSVHSPQETIADWPEDCLLERPYHGLFQTRTLAMFVCHCIELLWTLRLGMLAKRGESRAQTLAYPMLVAQPLLLVFGPLTFLWRLNGAPCADTVPEYIFVGTASTCAIILGVIFIVWLPRICKKLAAQRAAVESGDSGSSDRSGRDCSPCQGWRPLGLPLGLCVLVLVLQIAVLEAARSAALGVQPGPPWAACSVDYKEFYLPRHRGLLLFLYSQLAAVPLATCGFCLWP